MAARIDAQARADPVQQYVESLPDVFGGLYWSHSPFELVITATRKATPAQIQGALALAPAGAPVRIAVVEYSTSSLSKARAGIRQGRDQQKWDLSYFGFDVKANSVVVGRMPGTVDDAAVRAAAGDVAVEFEDAAPRTMTACTPTNCSPVRGGIYITSSGTGKCTMSMSARTTVGTRYLVTAGHCGYKNEIWKQYGVTITGGSDRNTFDLTSAKSDALRAPYISSGRVQPPYNTVFISDAYPARAISAKDSTPAQGDTACIRAWFYTTGLTCGTVTNPSLDIAFIRGTSSDYINAYDAVLTSVTANATYGESGSPVIRSTSILGVAVFSTTVSGVKKVGYSQVDDIESDLNVWFCLTSSCN